MTSFIGYHLARYIGQDGVKSLVTGEEVNGQNVTWDDERVLAAAQSFADFAKKGYFSKNIATNVYPAGQNQEFAPGDAAIVICGSWLPNEAKASVAEDLEWGYFNYPSVPNGTDDNTANNIANQVFAINKDSKMADEAFELITYITTGDYDKEMTTEALCIPTDKANAEAWPAELAEVKPGFDSTTTYYDWAVGAENNADLTSAMQEGFVKLDRRRGAVVSLDIDKIQAIEEMRQNLDVVLACGICRDVSRDEAHQLVDEIYDRYTKRDIETRED